jgi:hypothetical protein
LKHRAQSFTKWISEEVEYHKELNPKIWNNNQMDPEIRKTLLLVAQDFWESLKLEVPIVDIQLTGSIANFNWNESSDLDVHIIIDFATVDDNVELVRKALDGQRFIWNQRHNVILKGHDVETYVQDQNEQHIASGLFSILKNQWIIVPTWKDPQIDQKDVSEKVRVIKKELALINREVGSAREEKAQQLYDYLERFKKKIMQDRKTGLAAGGEFSVENMVFKELRRDGTIEEIIDTLADLYSKIYSK